MVAHRNRRVLVGLLIVLIGCSGPISSDGASPDGSGSGQPSASGGSKQKPTPGPAPNIIAWFLGLGPNAPAGPPEFTAFSLLRGRDADDNRIKMTVACSTLERGVQPGGDLPLAPEAQVLYLAAARACLAAMSGNDQKWEAAAHALSTMQKPLSCMDLAVYMLLKRLIRANEQNPTGVFRFRRSNASSKPLPCPEIGTMTPISGPSGTTVTITGTNLHRVQQVAVYPYDESGALSPDTFEPNGDPITVTVEKSTGLSPWACVVLRGAPGWNGTGQWFTFVEPDPSPTASPSAPPTPNPALACPPPSEV
jgi:hypothetical protein